MIKILSSMLPRLMAIPPERGAKFAIEIGTRTTQGALIYTNHEPNIKEFTDVFSVPRNLVGTGLMLDVCKHKKAKHGLPEDWEFSRIWDEMDHHYMELRWYIVEINE